MRPIPPGRRAGVPRRQTPRAPPAPTRPLPPRRALRMTAAPGNPPLTMSRFCRRAKRLTRSAETRSPTMSAARAPRSPDPPAHRPALGSPLARRPASVTTRGSPLRRGRTSRPPTPWMTRAAWRATEEALRWGRRIRAPPAPPGRRQGLIRTRTKAPNGARPRPAGRATSRSAQRVPVGPGTWHRGRAEVRSQAPIQDSAATNSTAALDYEGRRSLASDGVEALSTIRLGAATPPTAPARDSASSQPLAPILERAGMASAAPSRIEAARFP